MVKKQYAEQIRNEMSIDHITKKIIRNSFPVQLFETFFSAEIKKTI